MSEDQLLKNEQEGDQEDDDGEGDEDDLDEDPDSEKMKGVHLRYRVFLNRFRRGTRKGRLLFNLIFNFLKGLKVNWGKDKRMGFPRLI